MSLVKCPRCELNYMNDTDEMCSVCRREVRGESEQYEMIELCSECGENPVVPGYELCSFCLKELQHRPNTDGSEDVVVREDPNIGIDSMSTMDEIDLGGDMDDVPFDDAGEGFGDDEDDEDQDDDEDEDEE